MTIGKNNRIETPHTAFQYLSKELNPEKMRLCAISGIQRLVLWAM